MGSYSIKTINKEFHGFSFCEVPKGPLVEKAYEKKYEPIKTNIQRDKKTWEKGSVVFLNTGNLRGKSIVECLLVSGSAEDLASGVVYTSGENIAIDSEQILSLRICETAEILTHTVDTEPCENTAHETLMRMKLAQLLINEPEEEKKLASRIYRNLLNVSLHYRFHSQELYQMIQAGRYQKLVFQNKSVLRRETAFLELTGKYTYSSALDLVESIYGIEVKLMIEVLHQVKREAVSLNHMSPSTQILLLVTQFVERLAFGFYPKEVYEQMARIYGEHPVLIFLMNEAV